MANNVETLSPADKELLKMLRLKVKEMLVDSKPSEKRVFVRDAKNAIRPTRTKRG